MQEAEEKEKFESLSKRKAPRELYLMQEEAKEQAEKEKGDGGTSSSSGFRKVSGKTSPDGKKRGGDASGKTSRDDKVPRKKQKT